MARYSTQTAAAYSLFQVVAFCPLLSAVLSTLRDAPRITIHAINLLWYGGWFMSITTALVLAYFHYDRRTIQRLFQQHVKIALENDLQDPVATYHLRCCDGITGFEPTGPWGLWVAEDGGEVIGMVSLSNSKCSYPQNSMYSRLISNTQKLLPAVIQRLQKSRV
jgi:hypothetical protein